MKSTKAKVIVGAVVVLVVLGIIGSLNPPADQSGSGPAGASAAAATDAATQAPTTLLSVSGNGIKQTQTFSASGEWAIAYQFDCSDFGQSGNFQVTVYSADGSLVDLPVNALAENGQDTSFEHASGSFYLDVNSECSWSLAVSGQP